MSDDGWCMFEKCGKFSCVYSDEFKSCDDIRIFPTKGDAFCNIVIKNYLRNSQKGESVDSTQQLKQAIAFLGRAEKSAIDDNWLKEVREFLDRTSNRCLIKDKEEE